MFSKSRRYLAIGSALAAALCATTHAVRAQGITAENLHAGTLEVPVNKSQVVSTDRTIAKALVGNDDIADVLPVTTRSIYVLGKKMGTTSLTLYDATGRVLSIMDVAVGPDVEGLRSQLKTFVPNDKIDARLSNDAIVLSGLVNDPGAIDRAVQLARTYAGDKVVNLISLGSSQQVMLEVKFAEVNRTAGFDVGVSGFANKGTFESAIGKGAQLVPGADVTVSSNAGGVSTSTTIPGASILKLSSITGSFGIFRKSFSIDGLGIDAVLNALETKGMAKTLAQPTLLALSGERASFLAGGEFPVPVVQSGTTGAGNGNGGAITVEFKPFGVSLGFTPTVLGDKTINLLVEPEVSAIDPTASLTVGSITIPGLRTRRASTTLELRDGESFAIAGLLQKDFKTSVQQLPLLGSLPIIGSLFRSSAFSKGETELLIVVTPRLVSPIKPEQVRLPTDAVTDPSAASTIFLGEPSFGKKLAPTKPQEGSAAPLSSDATPIPPQANVSELPALPATDARNADYAY